MGWMILSALLAGCSGPRDPGGSDDSQPDSGDQDDSGKPPPPLPMPTTWVDCNWASVPASPISSVWVGTSTTWFASSASIYTLDVPTHTLLKDTLSPTGTRAIWADASDNLYTVSTKTISMRPSGGAWTTIYEEPKRTLMGLWGNDLGLWVGTSDGSILHMDTKGVWSEEDIPGGSFVREIWGRDTELYAATAVRIYRRSPTGVWTMDTEIEESTTETFEDIVGAGTTIWATIATSGTVLRRDGPGKWTPAGPPDATGDVHLWTQEDAWYATDGLDTWVLSGTEWSGVTGPEKELTAIAVGSNGTTAYALGGGDAIALSDSAADWDLVLGSPWSPIYDATVVGGNMFAGGESGLYPNDTSLVRYISDGYWTPELHGGTVRSLLTIDDAELWAAGDGAVWHRTSQGAWTVDLDRPKQVFTGLGAAADGSLLAVTADGTFFLRALDGTWSSEPSGATSLASVYADGEQIWGVGSGIFRRDPGAGWIDESPTDGATFTFSDIDAVYDPEGNKVGIWAVGQKDGMPTIYGRGPDPDSGWSLEPMAPDFTDASSGIIASIWIDDAFSIWLLGEHVTKKNGDSSFVMHSDPKGWIGEEPGGGGVARKMIWISDRRWVFGDAIDVRPRTQKGCI